MPSKVYCFRCNTSLLSAVNQLAELEGISRSALIVRAVRQLNKEVRRRRGKLIPSYRPSCVKPEFRKPQLWRPRSSH